jgi:hypothetical protein
MHSLPVTPLNLRISQISLPSKRHLTTASPSALPWPSNTSVSIITPSAVTLKVSKEANAAGVPAIRLQPGSFDDEGLEYARAIICSLRVLSLGGGSG